MKNEIPMPRPRILGSPRLKRNETSGQNDPALSFALRQNSNEPDCEIIKINGDDDEKKSSKLFNTAMTIELSQEQPKEETDGLQFVKQCPLRVQQFNGPLSERIVTPISPSLALQFVPDAAMRSTMNANNMYSGESIVMVLPVNSGSSQVFKAPTLCTLQRIDNPNEISRLKEIVAVQQENVCTSSDPPPLCSENVNQDSKKCYDETRKRTLQNIFTWIKKERCEETIFSDDLKDSIPASGEMICESSNRAKTSNSLSVESDDTVTENKIGAVNQIEVDCKLPATSKIRDPFDISDRFISVSNHTVDNCSTKRQINSRESDNISSSLECKKRPVPRLTKIGKTYGECVTITSSQESCEVFESSENEKKSIFTLGKSFSNPNNESSITLTRRLLDDVQSLKNKKRSVPLLKELAVNIMPLDINKNSTNSSKWKECIDSDDSSNGRSNSSSIFASTSPEVESSIKSKQPKDFEISRRELYDISRWTAQCTVCNETFSDRNKFHKHATLAHPDVQILFCDFCNDSFLTDHELRDHRAVHGEHENSRRDVKIEAIGTEDVNDNYLASKIKSETCGEQPIARRCKYGKSCCPLIEPSPGHSRIQNRRPRGRPPKNTKIMENDKTVNLSRPFSPDSSGVERRKPQTKNKSVIVKYSYVEEDVVKHGAMASKSKFKSAEVKRLSVDLTRLNEPVLQKYLEKLAVAPITEIGIENPLKVSSSDSEQIVVLRRGKRKRWPSMKMMREEYAKLRNHRHVEASKRDANHDSDTDEILDNKDVSPISSIQGFSNVSSVSDDEKISASMNLAKKRKYNYSQEPIDSDCSSTQPVSKNHSIESDDSTTQSTLRKSRSVRIEPYTESFEEKNHEITKENRTIIRKLTSRFSPLEIKRPLRHPRNPKRRSNGRENGSSNSGMKIGDSINKQNISGRYMRIHNQRRDSSSQSNISVNEEFSPGSYETNESKKLKVGQISLITPKKTYLPSKRYSEIAAKLRKQCNDAKSNVTRSNEPCSACEELLTTMKRVTAQFETRSVDRHSVKCPFCDLHFIAMFYLEEHVAGNHLRCKSETPCRRSREYDSVKARLDCEAKIKLVLECPQCTTKFFKEKDLNDHIVTDHDIAMPFKEISTSSNKPNYLNDLANCCLQTQHQQKVNNLSTKDSCPKGDFTSYERIVEAMEVTIKNQPKFVCWLCDAGFEEHAEYARHLREVHNAMREKIPPTPTLDQTDQTIADREYLLKQLLSDDSMDDFEEINDSEVERNAKEVTVKFDEENINGSSGKKVVGLLSSDHTCKVCFKEFNRAQDFLIHSLSHEKNNSEGDGKLFKLSRIATSNENSLNSGSENDNFVIHEELCSRQKIAIDNKRNATKLTDKFGKYFFPKRSRYKQIIGAKSETNEIRNEKRRALKELLDTEASLANDTSANDKVPIECVKCNRKFPDQASLTEHLFFLHDDSLKDTVLTDVLNKKPKNLRQRWRCRACRQDFKFLQGYRRHRYLAHGDESMVHVCDNCCKILTTVTMVNVHICTDVASYNCRTCDETFPTGMSLRLHNSEKHMENDEPNICEPCNKNFLTKSMLKRHEKSRHRFLRPYRPRKTSPVLMATHDTIRAKKINSDDSLNQSDECEFRFNDNENDCEFELREENDKGKLESHETLNENCTQDIKHIRNFRNSSHVDKYLEINENDIHRCSLCRLYCLTKSALDTHIAKSHSGTMKICQICRKLYAHGKVIRHMIDYHINPCESSLTTNDSFWNIEKNTNERDIELFVKILGMQRLTNLWDYRGCDETMGDSSLDCSACGTNLSNISAYRFHIFMNHDATCLLCNIEFKSAKDAARHKNEEHRSAECYMWFVDRTLKELTATRNFHEIVEKSFIDMISRETDESHKTGDFDDGSSCSEETDTENQTESIEKTENTKEMKSDENLNLSVDFNEKQVNVEESDEKLIIVVTDEDLEKYNIGTHYPNIWGLASQISSTCESLTPKDVKEILESYFEN